MIRARTRSTSSARSQACCSLLKLPDNTVKVLVEGLSRAKVGKYIDRSEFYEASATPLADTDTDSIEAEALARSVRRVRELREAEQEDFGGSRRSRSADQGFPKLADLASHLAVKIPDRQGILETLSVTQRMEKVLG